MVAIVIICYLIGQGAKLITGIKDEFIPVIVGVAGGILGIVTKLHKLKLQEQSVMI